MLDQARPCWRISARPCIVLYHAYGREVFPTISFSKLLLHREYFGDSLRYGVEGRPASGAAPGRGPVVVWNCTRECNLSCRHCYASATRAREEDELTTEEAVSFLDSLKALRVPAVLVSGGEPLLRKDILCILEYGTSIGLRMVLSTNGTLLGGKTAGRLAEMGLSYAGISLDGMEEVNDDFRGSKGAFRRTLEGFRSCREAGLKAGLRLSLTRRTLPELPEIFRLVEEEGISRLCLYHLVYSGRGSSMRNEDLSGEEKRRALDFIIERTLDFGARSVDTEILTVDSHCDGIYLYLRMKERDEARAERILDLLTRSGGNRSGMGIGAVDWRGDVFIDQFTREFPLGNIREKSFGEIWDGIGIPLLEKLRDRKRHLKGRCGGCRWLEQCNGNFRARALSTGDFWNPDPACYLSDGEIGLEKGQPC